jgi:hypothetical protein
VPLTDIFPRAARGPARNEGWLCSYLQPESGKPPTSGFEGRFFRGKGPDLETDHSRASSAEIRISYMVIYFYVPYTLACLGA